VVETQHHIVGEKAEMVNAHVFHARLATYVLFDKIVIVVIQSLNYFTFSDKRMVCSLSACKAFFDSIVLILQSFAFYLSNCPSAFQN
jgi:hypothetical protein